MFLTLLAIGAATTVSAMAMRLSIPEDITKASLIVRLKILDSRELPPPAGVKKDDWQAIYYRELARAKITDCAKGGKHDEMIEIEHNNGLDCPNMIYSQGMDCIVFLRRLPNGHYETMNTYCGCFFVEQNGLVETCYLFPAGSRLNKAAKPADIISELRRIVGKKQ